MLINFVRAIILYLVVLLVTRLMGKREIGQLQPFEFVSSLMIANLATIPISDVNVPITDGIIPMLGLLSIHLVIGFFNLKFAKFRMLVSGKPDILVSKGKVDEKALHRERMTYTELEERLREKDIFSLDDVDYVILETNGEVSVILKPEKINPTLEDLSLPAKDEYVTSYNNKGEFYCKKQLKK